MLKDWLLVIIWSALIFLGSSIPGASVSENRTLDFLAHKLVHLFEYSVLFALVYRAVKRSIRKFFNLTTIVGKLSEPISFVLTVGYAVTDEIHQMFVRGREAKFHDIMIDAVAALVGWVVIRCKRDESS